MSTNAQTILFDFDGTLADSEPLHFQAWVQALPSDFDLTYEYYLAACVGVADLEMINALNSMTPTPRSMEEMRAIQRNKKQIFQNLIADLDVIPQASLDAIRELKGYRLGVVTSSNQNEVEMVLKRSGLFPLFDVRVYGNDVVRHKPDPEPYLLAMSRLGVSTALVFEDSQAGMASARAAGCTVVQVPHPKDLPELIRERTQVPSGVR